MKEFVTTESQLIWPTVDQVSGELGNRVIEGKVRLGCPREAAPNAPVTPLQSPRSWGWHQSGMHHWRNKWHLSR